MTYAESGFCLGGKAVQLQLKHLAHFPTQPIDMRWQAQWHSDVLRARGSTSAAQPEYVLGSVNTLKNGKWYNTPVIRIAH